MTTIRATIINGGVPVNALAVAPRITIQRLDTGAEVVADASMTDRTTRGLYTYDFVGLVGFNYSFTIDADPTATVQVEAHERYFDGSFDYMVEDMWNDRGLNPVAPKVVDEATPGSDIDEDVTDASIVDIHKDVTKVGDTTTITRV